METEITKVEYQDLFPLTSRILDFAYHKLTAQERRGLKGLLFFHRDQRIKQLDYLAYTVLFHLRSPSVRVYEAIRVFQNPKNKEAFSQLLKIVKGMPGLLDHALERFKYSKPDGKSDSREFANRFYDAYNRLKKLIPLLEDDVRIMEHGLQLKTWYGIKSCRGSQGKPYNREVVLAVRDLLHEWNCSNEGKLIAAVLRLFEIRILPNNILRIVRRVKPRPPIIPRFGGAKAVRFRLPNGS